MNPWFLLLLAGLAEIGWAVGLKSTEGFTRLWPSVITVAFMIVSFVGLSLALKSIPVGTAYAVWTGIGAFGVAVWGIVFFGESSNPWRVACILLIVVGIVGLKFSSHQ